MKWAQRIFLVALPLVLVTMTGCSGVSASHSVSPLDLLIPGFSSAPLPVDATASLAATQFDAHIDNPS